jgi:hypothetical protein
LVFWAHDACCLPCLRWFSFEILSKFLWLVQLA